MTFGHIWSRKAKRKKRQRLLTMFNLLSFTITWMLALSTLFGDANAHRLLWTINEAMLRLAPIAFDVNEIARIESLLFWIAFDMNEIARIEIYCFRLDSLGCSVGDSGSAS